MSTVVEDLVPEIVVEVSDIALKGDPGEQGIQGIAGPAVTLTVGSVTEVAPGSASASITGTSPDLFLNLELPVGITEEDFTTALDSLTALVNGKATPSDIATSIAALSLGSASQHDASYFARPSDVTNAVASEATARTNAISSAIGNLVNSAPGLLDTLGEIATRITDDETGVAAILATVTAVQTALATKAPLASPALTGAPTAPTTATSDNSTKLATTAFVKAVVSALSSDYVATADKGVAGGVSTLDGSGINAQPPKSHASQHAPGGADDLSGLFVAQPASITALRALPFAFYSDGAVTRVTGFSATGDSGGGYFQWVAASTAADDGGVTINPTDNTGAGRWVRQLPAGEVYPEYFGAKGDVRVARATTTIASGAHRVTWPTSIFTAADVGKKLVLTRAGTATATGAVASVPVTAAGTGYTSVPTAAISAGGGANASLLALMAVVSAAVAAGGTGYLSGASGTVTLTLNTGFGTQAQLTCAVTAGVVTAVNSIAVGGAYTVLPTLAASSHAFNTAGTGATFNLAVGVGSLLICNCGSGYSLTTTTAALTGGGAGTPATLGVPVITPTKSTLATTITAFVSGTQVDVADNFGNSGSAFRLLAFGTDDSVALTSSVTALANGGTLRLSTGKSYGHTTQIALPDDGRSMQISGGGVESTRLVALAAMTNQIYKGTTSGVTSLDGFTIEGAGLPTHNDNRFGSHRAVYRNLLIRNAAPGGSNMIWGDAAYNGQSYENDLDITVRIENLESATTPFDAPTYCLENYGTDNRAEGVFVGAYQACVFNANADLQLGRGHGFASTSGITPQYIVWDRGQANAAGFTCDNWAPGGAGIFRDYSFGNQPSTYVATNFVYTSQPVAGTNCIRIANNAEAIFTASSFPKLPATGAFSFQAADLISQLGTQHSRTVLMNNPGALITTSPGIVPSTPAAAAAGGSFAAVVHDGGVGGNALGGGAVDLSILRSSPTMAATGTASFAAGQSVTASATSAVAIGTNSAASGVNSHVRGNRAIDRSMVGKDVWAIGLFTIAGDQQLGRNIFYLTTTATTANQRLTSAGGGVAFGTVGQLAANSAWWINGGRFMGYNPSTKKVVAWRLADSIVTKGATVGSTALDVAGAWTLVSSSANGVSTPVLGVDTVTYGAITITITPPDTTEWHWFFAFDTTEIG